MVGATSTALTLLAGSLMAIAGFILIHRSLVQRNPLDLVCLATWSLSVPIVALLIRNVFS